jgi:hypothetical protein
MKLQKLERDQWSHIMYSNEQISIAETFLGTAGRKLLQAWNHGARGDM